MLRESLAEGVGNSVWGRLGDGQECGASPTEGHATGAGRIASSDGRCHARDKGGPIGLMQTVIHGGGEKRILPTVQGVHEQCRATTVGKTARAWAVESSKSGIATTRVRSLGKGSVT